MILVWLLHHVWNFHLVGLLRSSAYQNAATLPSVFYKALCIEPSVSAIHFTTYLFLTRARRRLSTGTDVCQRWAIQACVHTIQSPSTPWYDTCSIDPRPDWSPSLTANRRWFAEKTSRCGGRRKQKQSKQGSHLPPSSLSLTERLISDDQDLVEDSRSDIPVRITSHVNHTPTIRKSGVNFSNLISITTQDSHEFTHQSQSCIEVLCFNSQSCRQIATDILDMIVDTNVDVLMLTETWLYSHGDEAYITAMTQQATTFVRSPA